MDTVFYHYLCFFRGVFGSFLIYILQDEFPYEVLAAGAAVFIIFTAREILKQKRKKEQLPEMDERIARNISRFFAYISHISLTVLFILLGVYTLSGSETIPISHLWIFFFTYLIVTGIGAMIIKRR